MLRPLPRRHRSRGLAQPNAPVDGREGKLASAIADRPVHVPGSELAGDRERKVRHQVAVHGLRPDFGAERRGQVERDAAVHGAELELIRPVRPPQRGRDRSVHRRRFGVPGGGYAYAAVHRVGPHVGAAMFRFHLAVDGVPVELDARRDAHLEVHCHVVVLGTRGPVIARRPLVVLPRVARRGIDGADGHAVVRLHDLDLDGRGIAATRVLCARNIDLAASHADGVDIPVHTLDLQPLAARESAAPMELPLGRDRPDASREQHAGGERDGTHGQWSSWSLWRLSCSCPGRHSLMSPLNVSSSARALPDPIVKLNRCLLVLVTLTGKQESNSPFTVSAVTPACAPSTSMSVETPCKFISIQVGALIWYSTICARPRRLSAFTLTVELPTPTSMRSRLECVACTRTAFWFQARTTISPPKLSTSSRMPGRTGTVVSVCWVTTSVMTAATFKSTMSFPLSPGRRERVGAPQQLQLAPHGVGEVLIQIGAAGIGRERPSRLHDR